MHTTIDSQTVADLVDQVAALDDAPDRTRCAWFYADLARLAADAIDDYLTSNPDGERGRDAYQRGHDAGYRLGLDNARRRTRPANGVGRHRTAHRSRGRRGGLGVSASRLDPTPAPQFFAPADDRWRDDAACRTADPDMFFPDPGDHLSAAKAVAVCQTCPVTDACLQDALETGDQYGIRGGLNPQRRKQFRNDRRNHRTARGSTRRRHIAASEHGITLT